MPYRTQEILSQWLEEFLAAGRRIDGLVEVLRQDGEDGADTGLVVIELANAPTTLYLEPVAPGDPRWAVTFLARDIDAARSSERVGALAAELAVVAELCRHLEARSASWESPTPVVDMIG
ncbi:hypothetical protein NVV95_14395 [Herbiconiux sp. CPCC 205716]|uniref:Uncharacterized protein n=1 Tax=Herbiconiux gentiana TaxID=2970912 RepID=A0ABT2GHP4_9MICO|nr:hypothetical protein [Herbiconiux gentiana]MCS5715737.1 hypothetical protein [Herbiconiux gentiana]